MPRRKSRKLALTSAPVLIAVVTVAVFLVGEAILLSRSDSGQIALAHVPGLGDWNRVTRIVGRQLRQGMRLSGIPDDSLRVSLDDKAQPSLTWRMGVPPGSSLLRANYAITRMVEQRGARVLSGRETMGPAGESIVTLVVGLPGRPTHRIRLVRGGYPAGESEQRASLLAIVLYGFGDDERMAGDFFALPVPFSVALPPGAKSSTPLIKAAHQRRREIVLQLPLEPVNYPQVNPGPGTLLVTMPPSRISGLVRRYIDQGRPLIAVANHMGSLATRDLTVMTAVYRELRRDSLPFVHVAADLGVAYNEPDEIVETETRESDGKALAKRWSVILEEARGREKMTVWVRATPLTLGWLAPALQGKLPPGVHIVPLSAVIRRPLVL